MLSKLQPKSSPRNKVQGPGDIYTEVFIRGRCSVFLIPFLPKGFLSILYSPMDSNQTSLVHPSPLMRGPQ